LDGQKNRKETIMTLDDAQKICKIMSQHVHESPVQPDEWLEDMGETFPEFAWFSWWPDFPYFYCAEKRNEHS